MFTKSDYFAKAFCFVMLLLVGSSILAQNRITGKITNQADNQPVVGATVQVKGTTTATQSGPDGSFSITAPSQNSTLVITFVGFDTREIRVGNQTSLSIGLTSSTANLNEVVVTGYTAQKKKEITGAVSVIKPGDLTKVASQTVLKQLEGRASGVTTNSSGAPGGAVAVRIRGTSTLTEGGGDPLLIVDGVQTRGAYLNQLNPNDVESIQVLKDAATTAAYGIGANAGVIIINTKKGKTGAPRVDASTYYGAQTASKTFEDQLLKTSA